MTQRVHHTHIATTSSSRFVRFNVWSVCTIISRPIRLNLHVTIYQQTSPIAWNCCCVPILCPAAVYQLELRRTPHSIHLLDWRVYITWTVLYTGLFNRPHRRWWWFASLASACHHRTIVPRSNPKYAISTNGIWWSLLHYICVIRVTRAHDCFCS